MRKYLHNCERKLHNALVDCDTGVVLQHAVPKHGWHREIRKRDFDNLMTRLSAFSAKTSLIIGNTTAAQLSEALLSYSLLVEDRRVFFQELRTTPEKYVNAVLEKRTLDLLCKASSAVKANILGTVSAVLQTRMSVVSWMQVLTIAHRGDDRHLNVGLFARSRAGDQDLEDMKACQTNVFLNLLEKHCILIEKRFSPDDEKTWKCVEDGF